jgi:hypothetical protein
VEFHNLDLRKARVLGDEPNACEGITEPPGDPWVMLSMVTHVNVWVALRPAIDETSEPVHFGGKLAGGRS